MCHPFGEFGETLLKVYENWRHSFLADVQKNCWLFFLNLIIKLKNSTKLCFFFCLCFFSFY